jgi:ribosome-binding protein aMBF1 (putative translation factor)
MLERLRRGPIIKRRKDHRYCQGYGSLIFDLRMRIGITQEELAELLGERQALISRIEGGSASTATIEDIFERALDKIDLGTEY